MTIQIKRGVDVLEKNEEKFVELLQNDGIHKIETSITAMFIEVTVDQLNTVYKVMDGFRMGYIK